MNLKFSRSSTPSGSRFLYRNANGFLKEATIREWSNSGEYLNWDGQWITLKEADKYFTIVELLPSDDLWKDKSR